MDVLTIDFKSAEAKNLFPLSLKNTGFAVLENHPIDVQLISEVYEEWKSFFSSKEKYHYLFDQNRPLGYFPFKTEQAKGQTVKNLMEYFHYCKNVKLPKSFTTKTSLLFDELLRMASLLLSWLEDHLPLSNKNALSSSFQAMIKESEYTVMRISHYPPLTGDEEKNAMRSAPHEDINFLSLLPASSAPGLQILDCNNQWQSIHNDRNSIVVNAGDMLEMATQKYYKSTTHQVINPVNASANIDRYSIPFFVVPRAEIQLSNKHTAKSYFEERMKDTGIKKVI